MVEEKSPKDFSFCHSTSLAECFPLRWVGIRKHSAMFTCLFTSIFLVCVQLCSDVTVKEPLSPRFGFYLLWKLLIGLLTVLAAEAVYSVATELERFQINQDNGYRMLNPVTIKARWHLSQHAFPTFRSFDLKAPTQSLIFCVDQMGENTVCYLGNVNNKLYINTYIFIWRRKFVLCGLCLIFCYCIFLSNFINIKWFFFSN